MKQASREHIPLPLSIYGWWLVRCTKCGRDIVGLKRYEKHYVYEHIWKESSDGSGEPDDASVVGVDHSAVHRPGTMHRDHITSGTTNVRPKARQR